MGARLDRSRRRAMGYLGVGLALAWLGGTGCERQAERAAPVGARGAEGLLSLPSPRLEGEVAIERALATRRSLRNYTDAPLSLGDVAQLLWAAQGISDVRTGFRTAPSAGALYPLETYLATARVEGLRAGVYRYVTREHALALVADGDRLGDLYNAALRQGPVGEAAAVLALAAVWGRTTGKYGDRGVVYVHMEAGHAAQNIYLQAVALGVGTVAVGAFADAAVKRIMGMGEDEDPLYLMPIGAI